MTKRVPPEVIAFRLGEIIADRLWPDTSKGPQPTRTRVSRFRRWTQENGRRTATIPNTDRDIAAAFARFLQANDAGSRAQNTSGDMRAIIIAVAEALKVEPPKEVVDRIVAEIENS